MSVTHIRIHDFLPGLAVRANSALRGRPLAILGPDERIWAASPEARACGVQAEMRPRQARMRCPDVVIQDLDEDRVAREQRAFAGVLAATGLDLETQAPGAAYLDLSPVTRGLADARTLCADLGRQVRAELGEALQPALGWDSGKFTAQAAALSAAPGRLRLVEAAEEKRFLGPLSIGLLPLPPLALMQLGWLGIRTLGDFARLPAAAALQRFGPAGKLALRLAQGHDERPVRPNARAQSAPIEIELDGPTARHDLALAALMRALRPVLRDLDERLEGIRRIQVQARLLDNTRCQAQCAFAQPLCDPESVRAALEQQIANAAWPGEILSLRADLLEIGERYPTQLGLFEAAPAPEAIATVSPARAFALRLAARHGGIFFGGEVRDPTHPIPERRARLVALAEGAAA